MKTNQELYKEISELSNNGNRFDAIQKLDKLIKKPQPPAEKSYLCWYKATLLLELGNASEAYTTVDQGLGYNQNDYLLYKMKAELLYNHGSKEQLGEALTSINNAIENFNAVDYSQKIQGLEDINEVKSAIYDRIALINLKNNIENLQQLINLYDRISQIEQKNELDKIKQFESLALFTAIIAMIVTNIQTVPKLTLPQIAVLNGILVLGIIASLSLGSAVLNVGPASRGKYLIGICCFLFGIIIYLLLNR